MRHLSQVIAFPSSVKPVIATLGRITTACAIAQHHDAGSVSASTKIVSNTGFASHIDIVRAATSFATGRDLSLVPSQSITASSRLSSDVAVSTVLIGDTASTSTRSQYRTVTATCDSYSRSANPIHLLKASPPARSAQQHQGRALLSSAVRLFDLRWCRYRPRVQPHRCHLARI